MAINEGGEVKLVCEGYVMPTPSIYEFEWKTVYITDNKRSNTGAMTFSEKFFVPYITITYNYLTFNQFCDIMLLTKENQVKCSYYDSWHNRQSTALFTILQPSVGSFETWRKPQPTARGFRNVTLIFDGTNNGIEKSTITYSANGGTGILPSGQSGYSGDTFIVGSSSGLNKSGYVFTEWNSDVNGNGASYTIGKSYTIIASIILYAQWTVAHTVTFQSNGGSEVATQLVGDGYAVKKPSDPTRSGYVFGGWYTSNAFTTQYMFVEAVTTNITLYAKWSAEV